VTKVTAATVVRLVKDFTVDGLKLFVTKLAPAGLKVLLDRVAAIGKSLKDVVVSFLQAGAPSGPIPTNLRGYSLTSMTHFFERHTYDFFDFSQIKGTQGMWPPGTTPDQISGYLDEALSLLDGPPRIPIPPNSPLDNVAIPSGFIIQIGTKLDGAAVRIGQFFPKSGPDVVTYVRKEMEAIKQVKDLLGI
jgi:hypothetical protein